jgi:signal transduction histidine kinase
LERHESIDVSVIAHSVLRADHPEVVRLRIKVETSITSALLEGDPDLIERLVTNLLDNAIGHNVEGGSVHVSIGTTDGHAVVSIANTGPEIPATEVDRLFQPFQRLGTRRASHTKGHGLGLSIVRAIATAHGATITACPGPHGGLSVDVIFPPPVDRMNSSPMT